MVLTKWTSEMTSKFISLYREQECLWRIDSLTYRDRDARNTALGKMIEGMGLPDITIDEVKKKIKYLRSTYMVEVNKVEKSLRSGAGTETIYKPSLSWFHEMDSFIKYTQVKRNTQSSLISNTQNSSSDICQEPSEAEADRNQVDQLSETDRVQEDRQADTDRNRRDRQSKTAKVQTARLAETAEEQVSRSTSKRSRIHELNSVVKTMKSISEDLNKEAADSEFDLFGKYVGIQLKSLLEEDAVVAQEEIQAILTRYKLKKIRRRSHCSYVVHTPSSDITQRSPSRLSYAQSLLSLSDDHGSAASQYSDVLYIDRDETELNVPQVQDELNTNDDESGLAGEQNSETQLQHVNFILTEQDTSLQELNIIDMAFNSS